MLIKQKSLSLLRNLDLSTFGKFFIVFLTKMNLLYLLYFNCPIVLPSGSDKETLFAENFSKNSNLNSSGIFLPTFAYRTNQKVHNISVTVKLVKKVMINLNLSKVSGPD